MQHIEDQLRKAAIDCEIAANKKEQARTIEAREELYTLCPPAFLRQFRELLTSPDYETDALMCGWRRCGYADARRGEHVNYTHAAKRTLTPRGLTCLAAYYEGRALFLMDQEEELYLKRDNPPSPVSSPTAKQKSAKAKSPKPTSHGDTERREAEGSPDATAAGKSKRATKMKRGGAGRRRE